MAARMPHKGLLRSTLAVLAVGLPIWIGSGQATNEREWERAAGGKQAFEVATIKPADPQHPIQPNIGLNAENDPAPPGGYFVARGRLLHFIEFAYKVMPAKDQEQAMVASLPKWVATQTFVIEAKAPASDTTKDQMRLMTQSLLADRFQLRLHFETRVEPALAMVLVKSGKPGPRLRPHADGLACNAQWTPPQDRFSSSVPPGAFLPTCGWTGLLIGPHHTYLVGGRDFTMKEIADHIPMWQNFGRPVVDRTGLTGTYDFSLYSTPDEISAAAPSDGAQLDLGAAPGFTEALKEQLGVKLERTSAPVEVIVIDQVEPPSAN
jgi:bla regulator protein blaR1